MSDSSQTQHDEK